MDRFELNLKESQKHFYQTKAGSHKKLQLSLKLKYNPSNLGFKLKLKYNVIPKYILNLALETIYTTHILGLFKFA